ncbi:MAG: TIGR00725 family protein [Candidatus Marinimicrobia bacterium]|nr:TIGR00725 family protein [Candidatus Neomarinimicrobiota bacterium]
MSFKKTRISVFGGRDITDGIFNDAYELGKLLAKEGYLVYCGGGNGVMEAVSKGVSEGGGTIVGVLKGETLDEMNDYITIPMSTNMGITRNALLAYNCDVAVAISGKYGTLSEIAFAMQLEKPVVGLHSWDLENLDNVDSPTEVIQFIKENI